MTPGATAFTRTPREAYSIAVWAVDDAGGDVDDVAAALVDHLPDRALGDVEEPGEVHGGDRGVVVGRVVREGLADEDPRVVDQAVDPSEPIERLLRDALGRLGFADVTLHGEVAGLVGGADRARGADDRVSGRSKPGDQPSADALRRARDDRDLPWPGRAHPTR
jgi:hypothetical protein